jgi:hypothetical protein
MARDEFSLSKICGRWLLSAAVVFVLLAGSAGAQTVIVEPPKLPTGPGTSGVGGGAGLIPPMPEFPAAPSMTPALPPPVAAPVPAPPPLAAPAAPVAPSEPAREVRFSCDVAPDAESCRETGAPDGGGDDSECSCARDVCYDHLDPSTGLSHRVCEKAK